MIEPKKLLADLQRLLKKLEEDLRYRCKEYPKIDAGIRAEYERAKSAGRTAITYETWRGELITQAGVAWILGCVFVRFIEDNSLIETPLISGPTKPGNRLQLARDQHTLYFRQHPTHSDREYLESVFRQVAKLSSVGELFDERHNPIWLLGVSGDGASMLLDFWQKIDPATGDLTYNFTDSQLNTRFLGDLYQDLSEAARKKYALLQTPIFVEEFILDRTLTPAIDEFGFKKIRLIDPTCGSGHFLLTAFERLFRLWQRYEPDTNSRKLAQNALDSVYGVDLNPFATAIARFRLLVAALKACAITSLRDAPGFEINIVTGDSLLHGEPPSGNSEQLLMEWHPLKHYYEVEDEAALNRILKRHHYHVVVGNPPYIRVKDAKLNEQYRQRFKSCHMKYSLTVPFMERFFGLAIAGDSKIVESDTEQYPKHYPAGFVGMITGNSFMKQQFGKKLVETYIPCWDLTHVIDTSGAYIPGHGTPTVIIFGRNRYPVAPSIRTALGIRGEPSTPEDPSKGLVWSSIVNQIDYLNSQDEFISVSDTQRTLFYRHPWSIGGGGAAELKALIDESGMNSLSEISDSIGIVCFTLEDDVFFMPSHVAEKLRIPKPQVRVIVPGEAVRNWAITNLSEVTVFPYDSNYLPIKDNLHNPCLRYLWRAKTCLSNNKMFGRKTKVEAGLHWFEFGRLTYNKLLTPYSIIFANVATHNHFVFDTGGRIFNSHAAIIKLQVNATVEDHLGIIGLLDSSVACFWIKQSCHNKGSTVDERGARQRTVPFEDFYEITATTLGYFPIVSSRPISLAHKLDQLSRFLQAELPVMLTINGLPNQAEWKKSEAKTLYTLRLMIALQEELDWQCYHLYGLLDESLTLPTDAVPPINLGERAFEIVMARKMEAGELETTWFERHGSTPIAELPAHWPEDYKKLVERRIELIETDHNINLIERPEYKRRWNTESWEEQAERALRDWLLNRLEDARYWQQIELTSCAKLADRVRNDAEVRQVAEMYRGRQDFDLTKLVTELVESESVPFLPVLRYRPSGLEKRAQWEHTWELQRREDEVRARIEDEYRKLIEEKPDDNLKLEDFEAFIRKRVAEEIDEIPVPPKYKPTDFQSQSYWRLRGKLDVQKERFISYPKCERDTDTSPVIAWAGWDHLQQAQAVATYYEQMRTGEGWSPERLVPLLAGLIELLPWLKQWHNEIDPAYGIGMGDFFQDFVEDEARAMGKTVDAIRSWKP